MKRGWLGLFPTLCMGALIIYSDTVMQGVHRGLLLCGTSLIPALLPFMVVSKLLTGFLAGFRLHRLDGFAKSWFGVGGSCLSALVISFLGGYPVGAACVVRLYTAGSITKGEAERSLRFCNNSGPGFFVGFLGTAILGRIEYGLLLYLCHVLSALICGVLFAEPAPISVRALKCKKELLPLSEQFLNAVGESCGTLLQVCGLVLIFSGFTGLLTKIISFLPATAQALLIGSLELTTGLTFLPNSELGVLIAAFLMSWGGLCVHIQAKGIWQKAGLAPKGYYLSKLLQGLISALLAAVFLHPEPIHLAVSVGFLVFSLIFKKYAGNLRRNTV